MAFVRSLAVWVLTFVALVTLGIPYLILSLFDSGGVRIYPISTFFLRCVAFFVGIRIESSGRDDVPLGATYIVMPNHRSWWDIPAVWLGIAPLQLRFVAKKELGDIPVFGLCLKRGGHVLIDRNDRESAIRVLRDTGRTFSGKFSIVIFPEGTRSPDHSLLRFKRGGFHLARELGLPIVPVSVVGGERIMRKGSLVLRPGTMRVRFHEPIPTAGVEDLDALAARVRGKIADGLREMGGYADSPGGPP